MNALALTDEQKATLVTNKVIDEMMQVAGSGINYWAIQPEQSLFDNLPEGKEFVIVEEGDGPDLSVHYLSYDDVREAFFKILDPLQKYVGKRVHGYFVESLQDLDPDDNGAINLVSIDSDAGDVLVQVACFNEVIYG